MRVELSARGIHAVLEPAVGHIPELMIGGAHVLHAAPWRNDPQVQADRSIPHVDRRLGGTFLAAPFGRDDVHGGPPHGAPANARWIVKRATPQSVHWRLSQNVQGARVTGAVWVRDGEPALYQRHMFLGGQGQMTAAHHPMVHMAAGGTLRCAPKRAVLTEHTAQEPGAEFWRLGQRVTGWDVQGPESPVDIRDYPGAKCEDFAVLVEDATRGIGWTALHRHAEGDTVLILKRVEELPLTLLWVSNGGRTHAPWNGRHRGVLGIEDAICAGGAGFAASLTDNRITAEGVPSAMALGGTRVLRHAILRLPGNDLIKDVALAQGLRITYEDGGTTDVPFDAEFLA